MIQVEIDKDSGFCFGVTTAIGKAEEELKEAETLFCLGDIVHNGIECQRLSDMGLKTINHDEFEDLTNVKVLFRAHGEPPETYETAKRNGIELIDATCPVVLKLQKRIHEQYLETDPERQQIVIYGQKGHAEVLGLVGQTRGSAIVVESVKDLDKVDFSKEIFLYAQTTKPQDGYQQIIQAIETRLQSGSRLTHFNTICGQVSHRRENIRRFAAAHDLVLFVAGQKSSNGKVLFSECAGVNPRTYSIEGPADIDFNLFTGVESVGICGATSTPKWLMEQCRQEILKHFNIRYEQQD
ncbi:MAG: 4-hydroxy-3-methylbut-2-enyl diphosphate reductase [Bacteroidaceae bacterium]|nr:4-hydroxy-3-methylbut-2-enyl diphosphate reductase [Bacteroidaceae bacterium]